MKIEKKTTQRSENFTIVPNDIIYNEEISSEARLVLIYLLSRPDGWEAWRTDVMNKCKLGKDKYHRIMRELRDIGYIRILKGGKGGGNALILHDIPDLGGFSGVRETRLPSNTASVKQGHLVNTDSLVNTDDILNTDRDRSFERFWETYPKKVSKKKAQQAFKKYEHLADKIIADIEIRLKLDAQWQDKTFIPHPTTYLNGERWNDDITPIEEKQKAAQLPKNVNELMVFGTKMGLPARPGEDEYPYRQRLQAAL